MTTFFWKPTQFLQKKTNEGAIMNKVGGANASSKPSHHTKEYLDKYKHERKHFDDDSSFENMLAKHKLGEHIGKQVSVLNLEEFAFQIFINDSDVIYNDCRKSYLRFKSVLYLLANFSELNIKLFEKYLTYSIISALRFWIELPSKACKYIANIIVFPFNSMILHSTEWCNPWFSK